MRFEHFQMQVATTTDRNNYYSIVLCNIHYTIDFLSVGLDAVPTWGCKP